MPKSDWADARAALFSKELDGFIADQDYPRVAQALREAYETGQAAGVARGYADGMERAAKIIDRHSDTTSEWTWKIHGRMCADAIRADAAKGLKK